MIKNNVLIYSIYLCFETMTITMYPQVMKNFVLTLNFHQRSFSTYVPMLDSVICSSRKMYVASNKLDTERFFEIWVPCPQKITQNQSTDSQKNLPPSNGTVLYVLCVDHELKFITVFFDTKRIQKSNFGYQRRLLHKRTAVHCIVHRIFFRSGYKVSPC